MGQCDRCEQLEEVLKKTVYRIRQRRSFFNQAIEDMIDAVIKTTRTDQYLKRWGESEMQYRDRIKQIKEHEKREDKKLNSVE